MLGALLLVEQSTAVKLKVEQKRPTRSPEAVRKATRVAMTGYQGAFTTKNAKPKAPRKPYASARGDVIEPSMLSHNAHCPAHVRAASLNAHIVLVPCTACRMVEQKKPTRSKEAVRKATRQSISGYQGHSTTKKA